MGNGETNIRQESGGLPPRSSRKRRKEDSGSAGGRVRRAIRTFFRTVLVLFVLVLMAAGVYLASVWKQVDNTLDKISGDTPSPVDGKEQPMPRPKEQPVTILLFGLDSREATRTLNTDVIMAVTLNPEQKKGTLVSIPRDTAMQPSGYKKDKANAFYSIARRYGKDKEGGPDALVKKMFSEFLDVPVDYLVVVNFKTFEDVVDALGGIEVDVDMNMCYIDKADGTEIRLKKGLQVLDGKNALDFVRYRKSTPACGAEQTKESGDLERNKRQQLVIQTIIDKTLTLGGVTKVNGLLQAVGDNVTTDIPQDYLVQLIAKYANPFPKRFELETIALEGTWKSPYIVVPEQKLESARKALKARLLGTPETTEEAGAEGEDGRESAFAQ